MHPAPPITNPAAALTADGLSKSFGRFVAVDRVSFTVQPGEIFGFLGPNGAGKSTTIRMLCGLLRSSAGTATVAGYDINRESNLVRRNIGYMSQKFSLYKDLTVLENMTFFGGVYGLTGNPLRDRIRTILGKLDLTGHATGLTGELSGALLQRLALGCAILHQPPILFLDEPTSGVDPISRRMFWDLIQELAEGGVTVLVTTHFMDEAEFCGRIGFITGGRLVALDTPSALKRTAVTEDLFEVELLNLRGAAERVQAATGVVMAAYFGPRLHMYCRRDQYTGDSLLAALTALGESVQRVQAVPVSLEDAFIRLSQMT